MGEIDVSVVIPVYNVEQYLDRCVQSVIHQTMKNIEIILVDDGSPDQCPRLCDEYQRRDARIRVIHKENKGVASARNKGMYLAEGKYVFFLDSDDWLELDGLQCLYNKAEEYHLDYVRCRAIKTGWPGLKENAPCMLESIREITGGYYDKQRMIEEIYPKLLSTSQLTMGAIVGVWGALYRLDFLKNNQIYFYESVKFGEDLIFNARVIRLAQRFYFMERAAVYHYFYNVNSISRSFNTCRWESCKNLVTFCEDLFLKDKEYDFTNGCYWLRWFAIMFGLNERRYIRNKCERIKYCKKLLDEPIVRETKLKFQILDISWKQKVLMILIKMRISIIFGWI